MRCLIDTDALLKLAACRLLDDWCAHGIGPDSAHVLPTARFQIPKSKTLAARYPSEVLRVAVEFAEPRALSCGPSTPGILARLVRPEIDSGEALFLALMLEDDCLHLVSGDKRALGCLAQATDLTDVRDAVRGKVISVEQVVLAFVRLGKFFAIREAMVDAAATDTALRICFSRGTQTTREDAEAGLVSYVEDIRKRSGDLLIPQETLEKLLEESERQMPPSA